jgi:hypothetical protein
MADAVEVCGLPAEGDPAVNAAIRGGLHPD